MKDERRGNLPRAPILHFSLFTLHFSLLSLTHHPPPITLHPSSLIPFLDTLGPIASSKLAQTDLLANIAFRARFGRETARSQSFAK